jgi:zinc/manganese transport system substrate-binding protein
MPRPDPRPHAQSRPAPPARAAAALAAALALGACSSSAVPHTRAGTVSAIGAESQYADVVAQVGGRWVTVSAIERNPNIDPHSFEASPGIARLVAGARLVVQNGLGYDTFMNDIEAASPTPARRVIDVQRLLELPDSTANPHLWYAPRTMPAVARAVAAALCRTLPAHCDAFRANAARFTRSLRPWLAALRALAAADPRVPVATTEPVADALLDAAGTRNETPFAFQSDVMNGIDPAPQDVSLVRTLLARRRVRAFLYNAQVTDTLTASLRAQAQRDGVPVVAVDETMPAATHYQAWMLAVTDALRAAVERRPRAAAKP